LKDRLHATPSGGRAVALAEADPAYTGQNYTPARAA